jgi:hypothetical protein
MSHPTLEHQRYMDSLVITSILREHGPMTYHDLVVQACAQGVDAGSGFDRALVCALSTCFIKAQFAACTAEEAEAYHKKCVCPRFDKPEPKAKIYPPPEKIYPPPEGLAFKLIQQRSDWIKAGKAEEEDP